MNSLLKMKTYRIDTGDSDKGVAGFVCYLTADSPEDALNKLRLRVSRNEYEVDNGRGWDLGDDEEFRVLVYLNPENVKIEEVEEDSD